jgi:hypothetical protein
LTLTPPEQIGKPGIPIYKCGQHYEIDREYYDAFTEMYQDRIPDSINPVSTSGNEHEKKAQTKKI